MPANPFSFTLDKAAKNRMPGEMSIIDMEKGLEIIPHTVIIIG
jgi:hypothetical protein